MLSVRLQRACPIGSKNTKTKSAILPILYKMKNIQANKSFLRYSTQPKERFVHVKRVLHISINQTWSIHKGHHLKLPSTGSSNFGSQIIDDTWKYLDFEHPLPYASEWRFLIWTTYSPVLMTENLNSKITRKEMKKWVYEGAEFRKRGKGSGHRWETKNSCHGRNIKTPLSFQESYKRKFIVIDCAMLLIHSYV